MNILRDVETNAAIKLALIVSPHVGGLEINVETVNGIVFLRGVVQDRVQKNLAEDIARRHGGIDIKNEIEVLSEIEDSRDIRLDIKANNEVGDEIIRGHVMGDLESDGRISAAMINVDTADGVVRLTGVQDTDIARNRAEQIAWRVDGVETVINDIAVRDRAA